MLPATAAAAGGFSLSVCTSRGRLGYCHGDRWRERVEGPCARCVAVALAEVSSRPAAEPSSRAEPPVRECRAAKPPSRSEGQPVRLPGEGSPEKRTTSVRFVTAASRNCTNSARPILRACERPGFWAAVMAPPPAPAEPITHRAARPRGDSQACRRAACGSRLHEPLLLTSSCSTDAAACATGCPWCGTPGLRATSQDRARPTRGVRSGATTSRPERGRPAPARETGCPGGHGLAPAARRTARERARAQVERAACGEPQRGRFPCP